MNETSLLLVEYAVASGYFDLKTIEYNFEAPLEIVNMHSVKRSEKYPTFTHRPPSIIVIRASARGAGGRGSIPDRVTPKT